jgi:hypothetical protein
MCWSSAADTSGIRRLAALAVIAIAGCWAPADSGPLASPTISCVDIPASRCEEALASVARSLPNTAPAAIEVICVAGTCTEQSGAMDTVVTLADGSQLRSTTIAWSEAVQPGPPGIKPLPEPVAPPVEPVVPIEPVVPVEPQCQGVPVSMCRTMAETAFGEVSDEGVVQILVRCTRQPCTNDQGAGDTIVTYADGSTQMSSWEYDMG